MHYKNEVSKIVRGLIFDQGVDVSKEISAIHQIMDDYVRNECCGTTKVIRQFEDSFMGDIDVTECCNIGPIVNENYCPQCGKKIL